MKLWAKQKGFTIVELLIVIVVIAILAAISVVAYNGIQTRAENTKTLQSVTQYAKAIKLYVADQGAYPIQVYSCLGTPARCGNTTDTTGPSGCGGGQTTPKTLNAALAPYATNLPDPSSQSMACATKQYVGAWYHSSAGTSAEYRYYLRGNQSCDGVGMTVTSRTVTDDTTVCAVVVGL